MNFWKEGDFLEIIRCKREKKLLIAYQLSKQGRVIPTPEILLPLWAEMWPLDAERLQSKLGELYSICSWIKDCLEKYDYNTDYFQKEIVQQRTRQKRRLNRKYALHKAHVMKRHNESLWLANGQSDTCSIKLRKSSRW